MEEKWKCKGRNWITRKDKGKRKGNERGMKGNGKGREWEVMK